ncbi:MAG: NAD(P)H-hydrate dehydratase [Planctomyces sp.]|nr:NAD(P)H-hydrate dehydratase [Planctomyces sp.]
MEHEQAVICVTRLPIVPERRDDGHKGDYGHALIVAGQVGMSGAACLAGKAALRGGAGLVTVATPVSLQPIVAAYEPSYLTIGLPELHGAIGFGAMETITRALHVATVLAIGPGLGSAEPARQIVRALYRSSPLPMIIDADGLNVLAASGDDLSRDAGAGARIMTPHPGEFARLTGETTATIQAAREKFANEFARKHGLVLVLKGKETVITDGHRMAINTTGNSGMATGGTGDVLTGLLSAIVAQKLPPFEAAQLAVWLHGRAGDLAATKYSRQGLVASDLLETMGGAWLELGA